MPRSNGKKDAIDPFANDSLREALNTLDRSGAVQYFFSIRRHQPNSPLWSWWRKRIGVDEVDDVAQYCYNEGGEDCDYKIQIISEDGKAVCGPDGKPIPVRTIPAIKEAVVKPKDDAEEDPEIIERKKALRREAKMLEIQEQERHLEERKKRLLQIGDDKEEEVEEEEETQISYDPRLDPNSPHFQFQAAQRIGFPFGMPGAPPANPYYQPPRQQEKSDIATLCAAMLASSDNMMKAILAAQGNGKKESSIDEMLKMKTLFPSLSPKDIMEMMGGVMASASEMQSKGSQILMQNLADQQKMLNEKTLELLAAAPGTEQDDLERIGKMLNVGGDVLSKVIASWKGSGKAGDKVDVPKIEKKPSAPGLPNKTKTPAKKDEAGPADEKPADRAVRIVKERVHVFLSAQEQEMLIDSDAGFVVQKVSELWFSLPTSLRTKLEAAKMEEIYAILREFDVEVVDRILVAVGEDKTGAMKKWCEEFWTILRAPDEDEEGDDDDDQGDEPAPEGEPDGGKEEVEVEG
jgi:hypothetical protein